MGCVVPTPALGEHVATKQRILTVAKGTLSAERAGPKTLLKAQKLRIEIIWKKF